MGNKKGNALIFFYKEIKAKEKYIKPIEEAKAACDFKKERDLIYEAVHDWTNKVKDHFDVHYDIKNEHYIPSSGPCVFVCNHQGYADIMPFLSMMPFQVCFIAKKELKRLPFFGPWILRARGLLMNRGHIKSSLKTINEGVECLKDGFSFVIFPEGTRTKYDEEFLPFKAGSFKIATKSECDIIPVAIVNSASVFERQFPKIRKAHVIVEYGEPIVTKELDKDQLKNVHELAQSRVQEMYNKNIELI